MKMPPEGVLIGLIRDILHSSSGEAAVGVTALDDAAVIECGGDRQLVIASDFIRGTEFYLFQLGYLDYFDVGYYLAIANISDMAAMGCAPSGLLTVVRYSKNMSVTDFEQVFRGIKAAADAYGTQVVGGDTGGYVSDVFSATAFSIIKRGAYLTRSGVRDGDLICVTGPLGGAIGALTYFKELKPKGLQIDASDEQALLQCWKRPRARVDIGMLLVKHELATSCMDISDGLKATIDQSSALAGMKYQLQETDIPVHESTRKVAELGQLDPVALALSASVDFELFFSVSPEKWTKAEEVLAAHGHHIFQIGRAGRHFGNDLVKKDHTVVPLPGVPWQHQLGDHVKDVVTATTRKSSL